MGERTNDLTGPAKPVADKLYAQLGSLKRVLSAGILALDDQNAEMRQYYMAKAAGFDAVKPQPQAPESEEELLRRLREHMQEIGTLLKIAPKKTLPKKRRFDKKR